MNRQQKESLIGVLQQQFSASTAAYVVGYSGLSVNAVRDLRSKLRVHNAHLKVAKMRLVKRAVTDLPGLQEVAPFLCQQRGVVFVHSEPTIIAKVLCDFAKDHEQLSIIAGYVDKECVDAQVVKALAMLPPRDVLRAQLLGAMQAPMAQLIGILRRVQVQLLATLHCINQKKENQ